MDLDTVDLFADLELGFVHDDHRLHAQTPLGQEIRRDGSAPSPVPRIPTRMASVEFPSPSLLSLSAYIIKGRAARIPRKIGSRPG